GSSVPTAPPALHAPRRDSCPPERFPETAYTRMKRSFPLVGFPPASRATDACPERHMHTTSRPSAAAQLYDPNFEHDACGIALIARLHGEASHDVVARAIGAIEHLFHRGAAGAD